MSRKDTDRIKVLVDQHFSDPEWFTTFEVPIYGAVATPDGKERMIDALAVSRLRGRAFEVVAIEVKTDRSDWLRELAHPMKSEGWATLADRYVLAAAKGVARPEEIPAGWGFLEESGSSLRKVVPGTVLNPWRSEGRADPMPREMWVRILRRTLERDKRDPRIPAAYSRGYSAGKKSNEDAAKNAFWHERNELDALRRSVAEFKAASGIAIENWRGGDLGAAVKVVVENRDFVRFTAHNARNVIRLFEDLDKALKAAGFDIHAPDPEDGL